MKTNKKSKRVKIYLQEHASLLSAVLLVSSLYVLLVSLSIATATATASD